MGAVKEMTMDLVSDLAKFVYDFDPYEFHDSYDGMGGMEQLEDDILDDLMLNQGRDTVEWLEGIVDDGDDDERAEAAALIERVMA